MTGTAFLAHEMATKPMFERAAHVVDRVLRGAHPGGLPIEQPMRFELAANLRTARAPGITLPTALLLRADAVVR